MTGGGVALPAGEAVSVYEVGLRDGLQNETRIVPTEEKLELLGALVATGLRDIELTSFVHPKWVPPLADADAFAREALARHRDVRFWALVPNERGLERALAAGLRHVALAVSASEGHSKKNLNRSVAEAVAIARDTCRAAVAAGAQVRLYLSTAWGCPYDGPTAPATVERLCGEFSGWALAQVALGDTIGVGTPAATARLLEAVARQLPPSRLALHLHDTRGTALANALVGLLAGIRSFDASVGGLGGCPYAPGASGNLATEELVFMLEGSDSPTGLALPKLVDAAALAEQLVQRPLTGRYYLASRAQVASTEGAS